MGLTKEKCIKGVLNCGFVKNDLKITRFTMVLYAFVKYICWTDKISV